MEKVRGKHKKRERRKEERGDKNNLKTKEEIKKVKYKRQSQEKRRGCRRGGLQEIEKTRNK